MIKNIYVQTCWNCRPKPICNCGNEGFGFKIKDCKKINLLVGKNGIGKSFALAHVNLEGKPFVPVLGAALIPPIETIYIEDVKSFELSISDNKWINVYNSSKYLVLDEIGNNTHYSVHKLFWKNLIKQIIEHDLQVFATTQSYEMIETLIEAAKETDLIAKNEIRLYRLHKNEEGSDVTQFDSWEIGALLEEKREVRGK